MRSGDLGTVLTLPVVVAALLAPIASGATAQQWVQVASVGPTPRVGHAMAYDEQRGRTVLFGGLTSNGGVLSDTWEWNGEIWLRVASVGPAARYRHALAYDSARGRTVLYGGSWYASGWHLFADTWEWDGVAWTQVSSTGPGPSHGHTMAYDAQRQRTVLHGGDDNLGTFRGDLWEWDGSTWTQVSSTGPYRVDHASAYDRVRSRFVLFGGDAFGPVGDTREWDGSAWHLPSVIGPSARLGHAMAFDGFDDVTVLFGGSEGSGASGFRDDTWQWNGSGWTLVAVGGPPPRAGHAMAYDGRRGQVVMFGGYPGAAPYHGDTWERGNGALATAAEYGVGCGIPPLTLAADPAARPILGTTAGAGLTGCRSPLVLGAVGFSNTGIGAQPLPMLLDHPGMAGCYLLQSLDLGGWWPTWPTAPGAADFRFAIPDSPLLLRVRLYVQACAFVPAAAPVVSNGLHWVLGNL